MNRPDGSIDSTKISGENRTPESILVHDVSNIVHKLTQTVSNSYGQIKSLLISKVFDLSSRNLSHTFSQAEKITIIKKIQELPVNERFLLAFEGANSGGSAPANVAISLLNYKIDDPSWLYTIVKLTAPAAPMETLEVLASLPFPKSAYQEIVNICIDKYADGADEFSELAKQEFNYLEFLSLSEKSAASGLDHNTMYSGNINQRSITDRFNQLKSIHNGRVRRHPLSYINLASSADFAYRTFFVLFRSCPYATLSFLSTNEGENSAKKILTELSSADKIQLLHLIAGHGVGLASEYLPLFALGNSSDIKEYKAIFFEDVSAGYSIFGSKAFSHINNYPFELENIEIDLPHSISPEDLKGYLESLRPGGTFSQSERDMAEDELQNRETRDCLSRLSGNISTKWKNKFGQIKKDVIFGDPSLIFRQVLFLVAHGVLDDDDVFQEVYDKEAAYYQSEKRERVNMFSVSTALRNLGTDVPSEIIQTIRNYIQDREFYISTGYLPKFARDIQSLLLSSSNSEGSISDKISEICKKYFLIPAKQPKDNAFIAKMSCRRYFFQKLGLDADWLFNPAKGISGDPIIEALDANLGLSTKEVNQTSIKSTFQFLLQNAMSLYVRGGSDVFSYFTIQWNYLSTTLAIESQSKNGVSLSHWRTVFQHQGNFFYSLDILFAVLDRLGWRDLGGSASHIIREMASLRDLIVLSPEEKLFICSDSVTGVGALSKPVGEDEVTIINKFTHLRNMWIHIKHTTIKALHLFAESIPIDTGDKKLASLPRQAQLDIKINDLIAGMKLGRSISRELLDMHAVYKNRMRKS